MKKWRRFEIRSSTFWKSVYKCGAGTQWRTGTVSGSVKTHPHDCFCSKRFVFIAPPIKSEQDPGVRDGHRVGRYGIKRGARMASNKYCAPPPATAQPSPGPEFEHTRNIQFWSRFFQCFREHMWRSENMECKSTLLLLLQPENETRISTLHRPLH